MSNRPAGFGRTRSAAAAVRPRAPAPDRLGIAARRLAAVSDTPRLDAELLLAHALGMSREDMLLRQRDAPAPPGFDALIERRLAHEPLAYIIGRRDFWTISLDVAPGVLIPRPDSETLIEAAVAWFSTRAAPSRILDLGTGSGALLLAALDTWPEATGLGIDASPQAVAVARANAARIAPDRAEIRQGNWAEAIDATFDLILCNPPYVEDGARLAPDVRDHEPALALFGGPDGLDCYRALVPQLPPLIAGGGMIAVEIGHAQAAAVCALFRASGLAPEVRRDLGGRDRAIVHFALGKPVEAV